ncbi:MAG: 6-phosphogluconate dehydrogenase [Sphingomonas sp. 28-66-16]|nr:MAG: 6-phosphogluconate dehydrogenase [Sphingomonas sp. 28-66-16]
MDGIVAIIGFGEAARAFVPGWRARATMLSSYGIKLDRADSRSAMLDAMAQHGVAPAGDLAEAVSGASQLFSLVTADQALPVATAAAASISTGALWFDMNSVAPDTKRAAASAIEAAGGRYVDVAVMAPVDPAGVAVPLLASGPHAATGAAALAAIGFASVRVIPGDVGRASSIKMIRSVMVKGIEALTAECVLAAEQAGVLDEVIGSLDASWPGADWRRRADYNLDRMLIHGTRRAAEMDEVVETLDALGTGSAMSRGTVERQRALGGLGMAPPATLVEKLQRLLGRQRSDAA